MEENRINDEVSEQDIKAENAALSDTDAEIVSGGDGFSRDGKPYLLKDGGDRRLLKDKS